MPTIAERNAAKVASLHPMVRPLAAKLVAECAKAGIALLVTDGYRSPEHQDRLYKMGRSMKSHAPCVHGLKPGDCKWHPLGATVTKVQGGKSWHNSGRAFDVVPLKPDGVTPWWAKDSDPVWARIAVIGRATGLEWGFDAWGWDKPHWMLRTDSTGRTLSMSEAMAEWSAVRTDKTA